MHCKKCGASIELTDAHCSQCGAKLKLGWKKPPALIRLVMQIVSLLMCLTLIASLITTVLLADIRSLTSSGGIEKIITALFTPESSMQMPDPTIDPVANALPVHKLNSTTGTEDGTQIPEDVEIPMDALTNSDAMAEFVTGFVESLLGEEAAADPENVSRFIEESTVMDFFAAKISAFVSDAFSGNQSATITAEEIMQLLDENQALLEDIFKIEITDEQKEQIGTQVNDMLAEADLDNTIRQSIDDLTSTPIEGMDGMTVGDLMQTIQKISQPGVILLAFGFCLLLMLGMCLLNFYNIPQALRWCGFPCLISGAILSAPLLVINASPAILAEAMPDTAALMTVVDAALSVVAPLHFGILILGVAMIVLSFLWRLFFKR